MAHPLLVGSLIGRLLTHRLRDAFPMVFALAVTASAVTACFTDPINAPPTIEIVPALTSVFRGDIAEFSARTTDDQPEPPVVTWAHKPAACPADQGPASWPDVRVQADRYRVLEKDTTSRFCVWAFATDSRGAVRAALHETNPTNRAPVAHIDVVSPERATTYDLYSQFRLSGGRSEDDDRDPLTFEWTLLHQPTGSPAKLAPCDAASTAPDRPHCFSADVPGSYQVSLIVTDGFGGRAEDVATYIVDPDRPPCLAQTKPSWATATVVHPPDLPDEFNVLVVDDDGDPFPAGRLGMTRFVWSWGRGDQPLVYLDRPLPWFDIPAGTFETGDSVRVRVEVYDRNVSTVDRILGSCKDDPLCAERPGSQCFQRITWKIEYR